MLATLDRGNFLRLSGSVGVVFFSDFPVVPTSQRQRRAFLVVQMSDSHWGFNAPAVGPGAGTTLARAVATVNALAKPPDSILSIWDLTHPTDDAQVPRTGMCETKAIVAALKLRHARFLPGEHDASLKRAETFHDFGEPTNSGVPSTNS